MKNTAALHPPLKVKISGGFVFLISLLLFLDDGGILAAALPAIVVHELCHIAAMRLFGARPTALSLTVSGMALDYSGSVSPAALAFTALSGPLGGAAFAFLCAKLGAAADSEYLLLCSGIGMVLSIYNLLPALPLDGAVALEVPASRVLGARRAARLMTVLGIAVCAALLFVGGLLFFRGRGAALLLSGVWLSIAQIKKP